MSAPSAALALLDPAADLLLPALADRTRRRILVRLAEQTEVREGPASMSP